MAGGCAENVDLFLVSKLVLEERFFARRVGVPRLHGGVGFMEADGVVRRFEDPAEAGGTAAARGRHENVAVDRRAALLENLLVKTDHGRAVLEGLDQAHRALMT